MTYTTTNPPTRLGLAAAVAKYSAKLPLVMQALRTTTVTLWEYTTGDGLDEVLGQSYFSNGAAVGLSPGDVVFYRLSPTDSYSVVTVAALNPAGSATAKLYTAPSSLLSGTISKTVKVAFFGDSRVNCNSTVPDVSGNATSLSPIRVPAWFAAARGDAEVSYNYGVSGDSASGWNSSTRSQGKTFTSMVNSDADLCYIQYGINDIINWDGATPAYGAQVTLLVGYLTELCSAAIKAGKFVVFESINPCTAAVYGLSTATQKLQMTKDVSVAVENYLHNFKGSAMYVDTYGITQNTTDGFANTPMYTDGTHLNINGALAVGNKAAKASFSLLPQQKAQFFATGGSVGPNFVDQLTAIVNTIADNGTATFATPVKGVDPVFGSYVEFTITPLTLSSGEMRWRVSLGTNIGAFSGSTPEYLVSAGAFVQGSCLLTLDDGSGKVPNCNNLVVRHRVFYQAGGTSSADWGAAAAVAGYPQLAAPLKEMLFCPPKFPLTVGSTGLETSTISKGYNLEVTGNSQYVGIPFRLRLYNPSLRQLLADNSVQYQARVAYAASVTPDLSNARAITIEPLTGNVAVANPAVFPPDGTLVTVNFLQAGAGGFTVSWGANYIFPTAWSNTGNTTGKKSKATFISDGLNLISQGPNSWY